MSKFGEALKRSRIKHNWSITDVARFLSLTRNTYSNYENTKSEPSYSDFLLLCRLFNLNPWDYYPLGDEESHPLAQDTLPCGSKTSKN